MSQTAALVNLLEMCVLGKFVIQRHFASGFVVCHDAGDGWARVKCADSYIESVVRRRPSFTMSPRVPVVPRCHIIHVFRSLCCKPKTDAQWNQDA